MVKEQKPNWNGCPVRYAAGIFADKWSFVLLRDILLHGKRTYGQFLSSEEGMATNMLATRLAHFEKQGLVTKHTDPEKRTRKYYVPTTKARALLPTLLSMMVWSTHYDADTEAPSSFAKAFETDPVGTIAYYEAEIDKVNARLPLPTNLP